MQVFNCFPKDKPLQCAKVGCTKAASGSCQQPLRGRLTGTICGRPTCNEHSATGEDGIGRCVVHAKIAARRAA